MNNKVYKYIIKNNILENGEGVILGVSGGADSICMLYVLNELKEKLRIRLFVVHVNHMIRGVDADNDAAFVEEQCKKLEIPFYLEKINVQKLAKTKGLSEEEAGREARYEIFEQYRNKINADKIAVAHQMNDQSETVLFHLFRGTGIKGLVGMLPKRNTIIRPLLCLDRTEIEEYLKNNKIPYHEDYTNAQTAYSRNKIRLQLLPFIKENINEKAEEHIINAAENLREVEDYLSAQVLDAFRMYVQDSELNNQAGELHPVILSGVIRMMIEDCAGKLKDITKVHIESVMDLFHHQVSKEINLPYGMIARRTYDGILITKETCNEKKPVDEVVFSDSIIYGNEYVRLTEEKGTFDKENIVNLPYTKWLDYDKIKRLNVRTRRPGDFLVFDDQGRKKTLKDYFIDEKIPKDVREETLLLADDNHIVWVIGHRISSYYKVTKSTKRVIRIDFLKT